jgi:exodeoxyribonuclease VII large subunit
MLDDQTKFELPDEQIYSVSELVNGIKVNLEDIYYDIKIEGEISNYKRQAGSGHSYLSLSDDKSKIDAVMFRHRNIYLTFEPVAGMNVLCRGKVTVYPPTGKMQLQIEHMEETGVGSASKAFRELALKLEKEGLFDPKHKKEIPSLPLKIGLVTSASGAAVRDFLKVTRDRFANLHIIIYPTLVQGEKAAGEIMEGLRYLDEESDVDVIVITRGGGSPEDLMAFNDERLARAVFAADTPVITAIGHQIDTTIVDYVSDLSVPTPSAAAERIIEKQSVLVDSLSDLSRRIAIHMRNRLSLYKAQIIGIKRSPLFSDPFSITNQHWQRLDILRDKINSSITIVSDRAGERLRRNESLLKSLNPLNVLKRGYSVTMLEDGKTVIDSVERLEAGEIIITQFSNGRATSEVKSLKNSDDGDILSK